MKDKILAAFLLACASLLFLTVVTRNNFKKTLHESNKSKATLAVLKSVEQILDDMQNYETSYRGYLITGDETFLESYLNIIGHYKTNLKELKGINIADSIQRSWIGQLILQVEKKIAYGQNAVNSFAKKGKRISTVAINEDEGKVLMDNIRELVFRMEEKERANLKLYDSVKKEDAERTLKLFYGFSGVMLLLLLILYIYINKEAQEKEISKKKISEFNASLEQRILERTAQLNKSERRFRALIENSMDGVTLVSERAEILYQSPATERINGFTMEERAGKETFSFIHKDDIDMCRKIYTNVIQQPGVPFPFLFRMLHKNGHYVWVEGTTANLLQDDHINAIVSNFRDVTDKLKAQKEVKKIADQLTEISSSIPGVVYQFKLSTEGIMSFTYVSSGMLELTRLTYEQIYSDISLVFSKVVKEDLKGLMNSITVSAQTLQPWFYVFRVQRSKDDVKWIRGSSIPNLLPNGDMVWNGTLIDITDLKNTEQKLIESEYRYRSLIEQASDAIMITDSKGNFIDVNSGLCKRFGYEKEELLKMSVNQLIDPDQLKSDPIQFEKLMTGASVLRERRMMHKDGSIIEVEANVKMMSDGRLLAIARDITERKNAEAKQRQQFEELQEIYNLTIHVDNENSMDKIFDHAMSSIINGLKVDRCSILLFDQDDVMRFKASKGLSENYKKATEGHSPWKRDSRNPKPIFIVDVENAPDLQELKNTILNEGIHSLAFIPLIHQGQLIGKFMVYFNNARAFNNNEMQFAQTIAHNIAFAVTRNKSEQELVESESRLNRAEEMGNMGHGYYNFKENKMILSNELYRIFGVNPQTFQLTIDGLNSVIHPDDESIKEVAVNTLFSTGKVDVEFRILRPDGEIRSVFFKTEITKNAQGDFIESLTTALDVTDRKRAALALQNSENRLRTILDTEPECVKLLDAEGKLIDMNKAGLAMIEIEDIQMVKGKSVIQIIDPEYRNGFNELISGVFRGESRKMSYAITGLKGTKRFLETHSVPMRSDAGEITALLAVTRDVTEKIKAEHDVAKMNSQLRELSAHLQTVAEEERASIAREIHDELGQQLTGLKMDVAWMLRRTTEDKTELKRKLVDVNLLIDELIKSVRKIAADLRPGALDDLGLVAALEWYSTVFEKRTGIKCKISSEFPDHAFPKDLSITVYRIYQEALTNVARHAKATSVSSTLYIKDQDLFLSVQDNGKGIDEAEVSQKSTLGLAGMRERARMLQGEVSINKVNTGGTEVKLKIHLNE